MRKFLSVILFFGLIAPAIAADQCPAGYYHAGNVELEYTGYTKLEYIESTGTQYIEDVGLTPFSTGKIELEVSNLIQQTRFVGFADIDVETNVVILLATETGVDSITYGYGGDYNWNDGELPIDISKKTNLSLIFNRINKL